MSSRNDRPAPEDIRAARIGAGLTQTQAAEIVHVSLRTWQHWEGGTRNMRRGPWEMFRLKAGRR